MKGSVSIQKFIKSVGHACNGIRAAVRSEQNFRIHLIAGVAAILLSFCLKISTIQFLIIIVCIGSVLATELINTAIEKLCNWVSPQLDPGIKIIKDLAAAAVFVTSLAALICGGIIFIPRILFLLFHM